ncbi:YmfQ family protein [Endozoicomonas sp. ALB115]|uniref:YmfQ family protein n=1 Tax=Endozoicomonas sp. ALB115 TaxID=3403074 RepID=UPI003BB76486
MADRLTRYAEQLRQLLPRGLAWNSEQDSTLNDLVEGLAETFARVDHRSDELIRNALPQYTTELLPEWEQVAGLPEECRSLSETQEQRRSALVEKLAEVGDQSRTFYIQLAARLGHAITITEFSQPKAGMATAGERCYGADWHFVWQVNTPHALTISRATAGRSAAGEPLASWQTNQLECLFRRLNQAHKQVLFQYG